jgi:hypothetical protein
MAPSPLRSKARASHPPYPVEPGNLYVGPPQIIYRKNNFGGGGGGGSHQIQILITFTSKHYVQYIAHLPFRAESQGVVQIAVEGLQGAL